MPVFRSTLDPTSASFLENRAHMLGLIERHDALRERAATASSRAGPRFAKRGQLLPRERLALLLDAGAPWLELSACAGFLLDVPDPDRSVPGGGLLAGIGVISGAHCLVVVDDSGIEAGALQPMGLEKFQRAQQLALENRLPFVHLVESAGANLLRYRVEDFIFGGSHYARLARLSAAGIPVLTVVHGSATAGGAYMPGLSDYVVMVRDRARAFLAGPPLLKAATGEIATEEDLGGALMHASVSGLAEYLAEDDADAIRAMRDHLARLAWRRHEPPRPEGRAPRFGMDELLGVMPVDGRKPVDMREVLARLCDDSDFSEFQATYGAATVCAHASISGQPAAFITNNGPLDPAGSAKATHFIQQCCQNDLPIVYLQ
ncbi:MAG TPA: carboxyl transferase domain-containing protein, partial [Steroidobacteraceae bacterium]|nr:carboxyl transferase domain-containing protein [Steroidobacteraceae bacterium]